jgi:pullulanase
MKKIITLILFLLLPILTIQSYGADSLQTLRVHYYRYDDSYSGFNFWMWENQPVSRGGKQWDFNVTNKGQFGVFFDVDLVAEYPNATRLGIILKQGVWDGYREVGGDRFIDLSKVTFDSNGLGHAYFVEQDIRIGTSQEDLDNNIPDYRDRILFANFKASGNNYLIEVSSTAIAQSYKVFENRAETPFKTGSVSTRTFNITGTFDVSKSYDVEVTYANGDTATRSVSLEKIYDTPAFESLYTYEGTLGVSFEGDETIFRVWAPLARELTVNLYNQGHPNYNDQGQPNNELTPFETLDMTPIGQGAWEAKVTGDYMFKYYTFLVNNSGITYEVTDPYSYSTGANGLRSMIVDFEALNPEGWIYGERPDNIVNNTDYIIYELHIRDLTTHSSWNGNEAYRGNFMGFTERNTSFTNSNGVKVSTGLDHLIELGVNAVHLLPISDFGYVDEVQFALNPAYSNRFNWGYMTMHFNTFEGTFSTNPFDGRARVEEFKQLVLALHEANIRVIMDVVYNHTGSSEDSNFNRLVPGYYHRFTPTGGFSNGSGTGNETASERSMMRKFIVDSTQFLVEEYNLSGLRFDLMALHDIQTMNDLTENLRNIDPTIIVYGEPWMGGTSPLPANLQAGKQGISKMAEHDVAAFNDVMRDAVKGSVFQSSEGGWVQGEGLAANIENMKYGIVGGINHVDVSFVGPWHLNPNQTVNYVSAHDNNTLFDKLLLTGFSVTRDLDRIKQMQIQSNAIVLTSQGIPFLHAGVEFMRSKPDDGNTNPNYVTKGLVHNSYESSDTVNQLRYDRKAQYLDVFEYYKTLIQIRQTYDAFRMTDPVEIQARLQFLDTNQTNASLAFMIAPKTESDPEIIVIHSGFAPRGGLTSVELPAGKSYTALTFTGQHDINGFDVITGNAFVPPSTTMILVSKVLPFTPLSTCNGGTYINNVCSDPADTNGSSSLMTVLAILSAASASVALGVFVFFKLKK